MTKLVLESGGDLSFKTWWTTTETMIVVGEGDLTGNAIQMIWDVRKQKAKQNGKMKAEHVDKLLQSLKIKEIMTFKKSIIIFSHILMKIFL